MTSSRFPSWLRLLVETIVYLLLLAFFSRYDYACSLALTSSANAVIVTLGARLGPLPVFLVSAYCLMTLNHWKPSLVLKLGILIAVLAAGYVVILPSMHSLIELVLTAVLALGVYHLLHQLPVATEGACSHDAINLGLWSSVGSFVSVHVLKYIWGRPRFIAVQELHVAFHRWYEIAGPAWWSDYFRSFPSGHTVSASCLLFLTLLPMLFSERRSISIYGWIIGLLFTAFIAFTRIMAGMHYLSDVMAGFGIYLFWYMLLSVIIKHEKEDKL